jgi:hypothetical protein
MGKFFRKKKNRQPAQSQHGGSHPFTLSPPQTSQPHPQQKHIKRI